MNLKQLLDDHQTGMSQFQDDFLVTTRAGGTLYGQYKQALRELYKRFRGLRELICKDERLQVDIDELKDKIKMEEKVFDLRRFKIDYKEKIMLMEESERAIKDTKREFNRFYQQAAYLKEQIGELTDEKRHQLDIEMWEFKIKEMIVIDLLSTGKVGNVTYEFLHACPKEMKIRMAKKFKNKDEMDSLIAWYYHKEEYHIPKDLPKVEFSNTKEMLLINGK